MSEDYTATELLYREGRPDRFLAPMDLRRQRATVLAAEVMRLVDPYICEHGEARGHRDVFDALYRMFWNGGFDIISDMDRAKAGLPPRGYSGWTADELRALERQRLVALMTPPQMIVPVELKPQT